MDFSEAALVGGLGSWHLPCLLLSRRMVWEKSQELAGCHPVLHWNTGLGLPRALSPAYHQLMPGGTDQKGHRGQGCFQRSLRLGVVTQSRLYLLFSSQKLVLAHGEGAGQIPQTHGVLERSAPEAWVCIREHGGPSEPLGGLWRMELLR